MWSVKKLLLASWRPMVQRSAQCSCITPQYYKRVIGDLATPYVTCLANGLRVATEYRDMGFACVGIFYEAGPAFEDKHQQGITHFISHMAFQGTAFRNRLCQQDVMSSTGARFHTIIEREFSGFYVECLLDDVPFMVEFLYDSIYQGCYNPAEYDPLKEIIIHEMERSDRDTKEVVEHYLHVAAYQGTRYEQTVLGNSSTIHNMTESQIRDFIRSRFGPKRAVLVSVGGVPHQCLHELAECYFGCLQSPECVLQNDYRFTSGEIRFRNDDLPYGHIAIAFEAPCFCDDDAYIMELCKCYMSGWNSRMVHDSLPASYTARASASGMADAYSAFYYKYKLGGLWGVEYTATREEADDLCWIIQKELMRMCVTTTYEEMQRAKNEYITELMRSTQSCRGAALDIARWLLMAGERPSLADRFDVIAGIHIRDFKEVTYEMLWDREPVVVAVGNIEALSDYTRLSTYYWLRF